MAVRHMRSGVAGLPLDEAKRRGCEEIERIGEVRRRRLSDLKPAKRDVYQLKANIARRAMAGEQAGRDAALALLAGEAAARGLTGEGLRDLILAREAEWEALAMAIAAHEAAAKAAIEAVVPPSDASDVQAAVEAGRANILAVGAG